MTPSEKQMIQDLFMRLRATPATGRDAEAEHLITSEIAQSPGAAYALTQTVLVQDQALRLAQEQARTGEVRLREAQDKLQRLEQSMARQANDPAEAPAGGGFLSRFGLGGGDGAAPQAANAGGGFLSGALQTAAGVAGGALLFQGVKSLFGGDEKAGGEERFASPWGGGVDNSPAQPVREESNDGFSGDGGDTYGDDDSDFDGDGSI